MDALYLYSESGNKLVEQLFENDINAEKTHEEIKDIITGSTSVESSNCTVISSACEESIIRKAFEGKFIFFIKQDSLYFVIIKKDETNPVMSVEVIREMVELFKKYFKIEKLEEDTITNNYSVVVFLINEILTEGGKPSVLIDDILKNMVQHGSGLLSETLKHAPVAKNLPSLLPIEKYAPAEDVPNGENANQSQNNGAEIQNKGVSNAFWGANNLCQVQNMIYVDMMESVNCVLTKKNRLLHFAVQGNVFVKCTVRGSPLLKMAFNKNIKLHLTHLHFTANYNMIFRRAFCDPNAERNYLYFVPPNEPYLIMQYFYHFPLKRNRKRVPARSACSTGPTPAELTNVLNLTADNSTRDPPSLTDKNTEEGKKQVEKKKEQVDKDKKEEQVAKDKKEEQVAKDKKEEQVAKDKKEEQVAKDKKEEQVDKDKKEEQVDKDNCKKEDDLKNEEKEASLAENRFKNYMEGKNRPVPEGPLHRSTNQAAKPARTGVKTSKGKQQGGSANANAPSSETMLFRDMIPSIESHEKHLLPIKVQGVVTYVPRSYKYNIKLRLILNEITKSRSNPAQINGYENISVKIPVYNFIRNVNIICTVGNIVYTEFYNSVVWCIPRVDNSDIELSAELTFYIQPNPDGLFSNHMYYYEKLLRYHNNEYINGLPDTSRGNGIADCCYHSDNPNNGLVVRGSNSSNLRNPVRVFPNRLSKWLDMEACNYPEFSFPVYVSFIVTGVTASGKHVENVELHRPTHARLSPVCRYSTSYSHVEFRI
ncbi:AP-3 complex subunit mu, putative [Plasmodium vivax]|uniref:AP-3 complex subunit mu, putative n=1 Tax=Plasmodium vivax TaxID=5855 RepID=A0A564ZZT6_PLAVI|nr:AP-3 complex subunit mu, putative [Plasmodium vivax]